MRNYTLRHLQYHNFTHTYSLHLFPINSGVLIKIQSFYSMGLRRIYAGSYDANTETMNNLNIRMITKTPTIQSLLYVRYLRQIFTWGEIQFFAYLNNKIELDNAFIEFDTKINTLIRDLSTDQSCICNNHTWCIPRNYIKWRYARKNHTSQQW